MRVRRYARDLLVAVLDKMLYGQSRPCSVFDAYRIRRGNLNRTIDGNDRRGSRSQRFEISVPAVGRNKEDAVDRMIRHHLHLCSFDRWILVGCG